MKALKYVGALLAAAVLAGCLVITDGAGVTLSADKVSLLSGELTAVKADAWSVDGSSLSYTWTEDGVLIDETGSSLVYSRFVTVPTSVTIAVTVRTASGIVCASSQVLSISPPAFPATLTLVNDSPFSVFSLYVSLAGETSWGPDQLRPNATIPAGGFFVLRGIPAGTWDLMATGAGGSPVWTSSNLSLGPGQAMTLYLQ